MFTDRSLKSRQQYSCQLQILYDRLLHVIIPQSLSLRARFCMVRPFREGGTTTTYSKHIFCWKPSGVGRLPKFFFASTNVPRSSFTRMASISSRDSPKTATESSTSLGSSTLRCPVALGAEASSRFWSDVRLESLPEVPVETSNGTLLCR